MAAFEELASGSVCEAEGLLEDLSRLFCCVGDVRLGPPCSEDPLVRLGEWVALSPSKLTTVAQVIFSDSTFWLFAIFDSISELLSPLLEDGGVSGASFAFRSLGGDMLHSSRAVWG